MADKNFDVLICGAGISGLYCARRLLKHARVRGETLRVGILEARDCVGGRIRTSRFPDYDDVPLELGAMRFYPGQTLISSLVKDFQLEVTPFQAKECAYHLRGETFRGIDSFLLQKRYFLSEHERGMTPRQLLAYAIDKVIPRELWGFLERIKLEEIIDTQTDISDAFKQEDLSVGFKNFLSRFISNEAFEFIKDGSGYDSSFHNWNAREAINHVINDFLKDSQPYAVTGGFDVLLHALEREICELGGEFFFEHSLVSFVNNDQEAQTGLKCLVEEGGRKSSVTMEAAQLILALPKRNLINVTRGTPQFCTNEVDGLLHLVTSQTAAKVFLSFDDAWWKRRKVQSDLTVTDMPIRNTYYHIPGGDTEETQGGVILAAYADMEDYYFWDGFIDGNSREACPGTSAMEEFIVKTLSTINQMPVPNPVSSRVIRWSSDNAGAAFHAWKPGVNSGNAMEEILKPVDSMPVYICGEAYSKYQCWIEGALFSAEQLLTRYFGLMHSSL